MRHHDHVLAGELRREEGFVGAALTKGKSGKWAVTYARSTDVFLRTTPK